MKILSFILFLLMTIHLLSGCSRSTSPRSSVTDEPKQHGNIAKAGPPAMIYKTKKDYFDKVPVTLSENLDEVVVYPSQKDIIAGESFSYPTRLVNGFLLDNRGIGQHSAFLNLSYEEYAEMQADISAESLYLRIIDPDPFLELYHCGNRFGYRDLIKELNELIEQNKFERCIKIK
jgi:hypothetical protein